MHIEKLDQLSLLEINGDDAIEFLQGQLTNDINQATQKWQYSGYCNPKGRLLALFKLWRHQNTVFALIDNSLVDPIVKRLRMYVMRSKVNINVSEKQCYGTFTPESLNQRTTHNLDQETLTQLANEKNAFFSDGDTHILAYKERFLCISSIEPQIEDKHTGAWAKQDINDGLPDISQSSSELFIPQMLNLDILNGINFKKGCYTGQEIIARMHYLGKVKQRMFVCNLNQTDSNISVGDKVYSDSSLSKNIGNIVSIQDAQALAVLRMEAALENSQYYVTETTHLSISDTQPYSLETIK